MSDRDRSAHPDSAPQDDTERRSDIEKAVDAVNGDVERGGTGNGATPPTEPTVSPDTAGGSGGVVRNQEADGQ
ncbi:MULTISPECIES: hypothetical protein [unclassified Sphingomonas]|uniref:hypothetical protein n=1 Tax=unclassified Sphingomonas TaxID=196159 RepID=UPI0006FD119C|nr:MULTISPECIES: hypothetical protein [unclassified Sphingomonas]KQM66968.1 hypothetical protein ASE65_02600 [Sphingomonas sp. Leaf16]KQN17914.1 hypothetical protein ASE81_01980 [Sphingomonas sp. Leaf29]KQN23778.1 hypothetical protein ASE83_04860 [Sphingomonas sp. Leaf32]